MRIFLLLFFLGLGGCQSVSSETTSKLEVQGQVTAKTLLSNDTGFTQSYQDYEPSTEEITAVKQLSGKSIIVFFGTWCHDSQREVPRLLKLLDKSEVTLASLQLIAVNHQKQEASGLYRKMNLRFTPTIILMDGETELGRIVERPGQGLGKDLANMLP